MLKIQYSVLGMQVLILTVAVTRCPATYSATVTCQLKIWNAKLVIINTLKYDHVFKSHPIVKVHINYSLLFCQHNCSMCPTDIYLFKVNNRDAKKGLKFLQI